MEISTIGRGPHSHLLKIKKMIKTDGVRRKREGMREEELSAYVICDGLDHLLV